MYAAGVACFRRGKYGVREPEDTDMLHPYGPLPHRSTCPDCKGSGVDRETDLLCNRCDGSGQWRPSAARQVAEALGGGALLLAVFLLGWSAMVLA